MFFGALHGLGWVGDGLDVVGNGWDVMVRCMEPYNPPKGSCFFRFCGMRWPAAALRVGSRRSAAHCGPLLRIFSLHQPPGVAGGWGVGGGNCISIVYTSYHSYSSFFPVFCCFLMVLYGFEMV